MVEVLQVPSLPSLGSSQRAQQVVTYTRASSVELVAIAASGVQRSFNRLVDAIEKYMVSHATVVTVLARVSPCEPSRQAASDLHKIGRFEKNDVTVNDPDVRQAWIRIMPDSASGGSAM